MKSKFKKGYSFQAEFGDESFEILGAKTVGKAIEEAEELAVPRDGLMNVILIDEDYNEIETVF